MEGVSACQQGLAQNAGFAENCGESCLMFFLYFKEILINSVRPEPPVIREIYGKE